MVTLVAGILLLAMGTNAYLHYREEVRIVEEIMRVRAQSLSEMLADVSVDPLLVYDMVSLNNYVAHATHQPQVVFVTFLDPENKAMTHYINASNDYIRDVTARLQSKDPYDIATALSKNDALLLHKVDVVFNNNVLARVVVVLDRSKYVNESLSKLGYKTLSTLFIGLMVGLGIFLVFRKKILHPINQLINGVNRIARSEFSYKLDVSGDNELSQLSDAFNQMSAHLKQSIEERDRALAKMEEMNTSLEERVHERTLELQALNAEIAHQAMHDPLTTLPNRTLLVERLQQSIRYAKRNNNRLAFLMIDLNNFKEVNDTLGHPEGDRLLIEVGRRLPEALRETDTVGRLGGDEFGILLPDTNADQAEGVAYRILATLAPSFQLDEQTITVGASIGIAMYPDHGEDHTALIRHADVAMYEAKRKDNKPRFYDPATDQYTTQRLALMADLHQAIENDHLELHYQPQINLKLRKVVAVEALLRWRHPVHGQVPPEQFITLAENSGLIELVSSWVIRAAIKQLTEWQAQGLDLELSLNLSARDLLNPDLPKYIEQLGHEYQVNLHKLAVEITESAIMSNPEKALEVISHPPLNALRFAIDDFGTGYSSLSYLKKLPVHEVKIDKSFVLDMASDEEDASIVRSVIDLTHNLGYSVVAEGVENAQTLAMLTKMGCDIAQGFYFSRAVPKEKLPEVIRAIELDLQGVATNLLRK